MPGRRSRICNVGRPLPALALLILMPFGCRRTQTDEPVIAAQPSPPTDSEPHLANHESANGGTTDHGPLTFKDICPESGIDFVHISGMTPEKLFPTANGSGVAVFDYDGDGKLDLYFATGNLRSRCRTCRRLPTGCTRTWAAGSSAMRPCPRASGFAAIATGSPWVTSITTATPTCS